MATRAVLRRAIAKRIQEPFFRRLGSAADSAQADSGTTTTLLDADLLLQGDDFWNGHLVYLPDSDEVREVSDFDQSSKQLTWLEPVASAVSSGDAYEIWSQLSPEDVHAAINIALRRAWPYFFEITNDEIVIQSNMGAGYDLTSLLTYTPIWVGRVEVEYLIKSYTGTADGGGAQDELVDTDQSNIDDDHVGWEVRVYEGTSAGDVRTISSVDTVTYTYTVSSNFTSTLDTTSKYRLVDPNDNDRDFSPIIGWHTDKPHYPMVIRLGAHPYALEGYVLRIRYESLYSALTTETGSTNCPQEFIELMAMALLYQTLLAASPATEERTWMSMYQSTLEAATQYAKEHRFVHLGGTIQDRYLDEFGQDPDYPF